jgi:hypothetical protein
VGKLDGIVRRGFRFNDRSHAGDPGPIDFGRESPFRLTTLAKPFGARCYPVRRSSRPAGKDSYLVDSASSHMLVSKIKPCMSKYKQLYGETANGSLNQLSFI